MYIYHMYVTVLEIETNEKDSHLLQRANSSNIRHRKKP